MKEEFIKKLVQIQLQWKFLHWQTFGDAKQSHRKVRMRSNKFAFKIAN